MKNIILSLLVFCSCTINAQINKEASNKINKLIEQEEYIKALNLIDETVENFNSTGNEWDDAKYKGGISSMKYNIKNVFKNKNKQHGIKWISYQEAIEKQKTAPKKILLWHYSKERRIHLNDEVLMAIFEDNLKNTGLIKYVNEHFYAVKTSQKEQINGLPIKFDEAYFEVKKERLQRKRLNDIKYESKQEYKARKKKEKKEGIPEIIVDSYNTKDFFRDYVRSYNLFLFIDENGKYLDITQGYRSLESMENFFKFYGEEAYKTYKTAEEQKKFLASIERTFVKQVINQDYFETFKFNEDYVSFINNQARLRLSKIDDDGTLGLNAVQSGCNASFNEDTKRLINREQCSSKIWLENLPFSSEKGFKPFEFELNFSLTSDVLKLDDNKYPLQIMLGNSPKGYTWLGTNKEGEFLLSYKTDKGFEDLLTVSKADKVHMDKPNHLKFIWFPNGVFYVELNSYKVWSFDLFEGKKHRGIPLLGLSNRISFYTDIIIDSMYLNTF